VIEREKTLPQLIVGYFWWCLEVLITAVLFALILNSPHSFLRVIIVVAIIKYH